MHPFCAFCLRASPANVEFFKHVVGSTVELRQSFQSLLGYNFLLANFSICNPCWKLMQLVQDFRTRCFKANSLVERIEQGLSSEDDWFSAKNLATIESVRMVIKDQMQQIERVDVTWDDFLASDHEKSVEQKEDLVSTIDVGEVKIEVETEAGRDSPEEESSYSSNENEPLSEQISLDVQNCNKCNRLFVNERALRVHLQKCTGKLVAGRLKTCHICSASFVLKSQLHAHLNIHEGKAPYKCNCCKKAFVCPKTCAKHQQKCVKQIQSCTICKETLPNNQQLMDHYRRVHPGEQRHKCSHCELRFTAKFTRQQHERRRHPECLTEHICPECGKRFSREGDLKYHIKYHRLERSHQCEICQKRLTSPKALQEHVARMHPELATEQSLRRVAQMQRATDKRKAQYSKKDGKESGNGEDVLNI